MTARRTGRYRSQERVLAVEQLRRRCAELYDATVMRHLAVEMWRDWTGHLSRQLWSSPYASFEIRTRHGLNRVPLEPDAVPSDALLRIAEPNEFTVHTAQNLLSYGVLRQGSDVPKPYQRANRNLWSGTDIYDAVEARYNAAPTIEEDQCFRERLAEHKTAMDALRNPYKVLETLDKSTDKETAECLMKAIRYAFEYEIAGPATGNGRNITEMSPGPGWWASPLGGEVAGFCLRIMSQQKRWLGLPKTVTPQTAALILGTPTQPLSSSSAANVRKRYGNNVPIRRVLELRCQWRQEQSE